jgi:hypothetical protein
VGDERFVDAQMHAHRRTICPSGCCFSQPPSYLSLSMSYIWFKVASAPLREIRPRTVEVSRLSKILLALLSLADNGGSFVRRDSAALKVKDRLGQTNEFR